MWSHLEHDHKQGEGREVDKICPGCSASFSAYVDGTTKASKAQEREVRKLQLLYSGKTLEETGLILVTQVIYTSKEVVLQAKPCSQVDKVDGNACRGLCGTKTDRSWGHWSEALNTTSQVLSITHH